MTILVNKPQIWCKIRPKTHRFEAKIRQKCGVLMQNNPVLAKKSSDFLSQFFLISRKFRTFARILSKGQII